jgi:hypothetical protein
VSFAVITLCVTSQRGFVVVVVVYFVTDSVRKFVDTPSHAQNISVGKISFENIAWADGVKAVCVMDLREGG